MRRLGVGAGCGTTKRGGRPGVDGGGVLVGTTNRGVCWRCRHVVF
jgi:hypothetical protein